MDIRHPPTPDLAPPAPPTPSMVVDGITLAPASRLLHLASIRDRHRARARGANDQSHDLLDRLNDCRRRAALIMGRIDGQPGRHPQAEAELAAIRAEEEQLQAARAAVQAEASEASEAAGEAGRLLKSACRFVVQQGGSLPATIAGEAR